MGIGQPFRMAGDTAQGRPFLVCPDAEREPGIGIPATVDAMRRFGMVTIAGSLRFNAVDRVINHRFRNQRHHRFVHREIDELSLASAPAVMQMRRVMAKFE